MPIRLVNRRGKPVINEEHEIEDQYTLSHRPDWLGRLDSNQGMPESKSGALPLGYAPLINDLRALRPWLLPNLLPKRPNRSAYLRGACL